MGKLATYFGLLRLPKMPELKKIKIEGFQSVKVDFNSIKYKWVLKLDKNLRPKNSSNKINQFSSFFNSFSLKSKVRSEMLKKFMKS